MPHWHISIFGHHHDDKQAEVQAVADQLASTLNANGHGVDTVAVRMGPAAVAAEQAGNIAASGTVTPTEAAQQAVDG